MQILFTNVIFSERTGTEVATLELARAMRERGHFVAIYSPTIGGLAHEARASGIPVTDKIRNIGFTPDIIHGHHNISLTIALTAIRHAPAIFVCHDSSSMFDESFKHSRIREYVAVDAACRERLIFEGADPKRITVIPNGVSLDLYAQRRIWVERPLKALLVVKKRIDHVPLVEEACRESGIDLEIVGAGVGRVVADLPSRYLDADIVFAHSRSAIEAAATGAFVIVIDEYGYGGKLDPAQIIHWPETSLSRRILRRSVTLSELMADIAAYSADDARLVSMLLRGKTDLRALAGEWEKIYERVAHGEADSDASLDRYHLAEVLERFLPSPYDASIARQDHERDLPRLEIADRLAALFQEFTGGSLDQIPFGQAALGQVLLDQGWYMPEYGSVWSAGGEIALWLPAAVINAWDGVIGMECSRFMPATKSLEDTSPVFVKIDGTPVATWHFHPDHPESEDERILAVPADLRPPPGGAVRVSFELTDAVSPKSVGVSPDERKLGLTLSRLYRPASVSHLEVSLDDEETQPISEIPLGLETGMLALSLASSDNR